MVRLRFAPRRSPRRRALAGAWRWVGAGRLAGARRRMWSAALAGALAVGLLGCSTGTQPAPSTPNGPPTLTPAGPIPGPVPSARALGSEAVIAQTTPPATANLAQRFEPTVRMSMYDRFWPVSVASVLNEAGASGRTCLVEPGHPCAAAPVTLADLRANASSQSYLKYPESLDDIEAQFDSFERGLGESASTIAHWKEDPATLEPYATAQIYFYDAGQAPYPYPHVPAGLTSLQYWFFYPLNYYPTFVDPFDILSDPLDANKASSDFHEGDWEHIAVLVDKSNTPRYLWMARHSDEGVAIPWSEVQLEQGHPVIYPALGGHPSYQSCGTHWRKKLLYAFADFVPCRAGLFTFSYATTPLVDLRHTSWACWPGHFGDAEPRLHTASNLDDPTGLFLVAGPRSPLRQAENTNVCSGVTHP